MNFSGKFNKIQSAASQAQDIVSKAKSLKSAFRDPKNAIGAIAAITGDIPSVGGVAKIAGSVAGGGALSSLVSEIGSLLSSNDVDLLFGFEAPVVMGQFVVLGFEGSEAIFDGYEITVDLASHNPSINLHDLLDTPATLSILDKHDAPRFIHGVIAEIEKGQSGFSRTYYRAVIKPALHRLNYASDSRIFQKMTVPDISKTILEDHKIPDIEWKLDGDHAAREYCVQYGETAYDFLRRIWAEEGIFFWFEHSADAHMMVISDAPLAMPMLPMAPSLTYNNNSGGASKGSWISRFNQVERLRATNRMSADYSFKNPTYHQQHKVAQYAQNGAMGTYELYQYPGRHKNPEAGQPFNDYALEAHRVEATTAEGQTNNIQLSAGYIFGLTDHPDDAINENHRLLAVYHKATQPAALEEDAPTDSATTYTAKFTTQPARIPYRPINPNPKPMVEGPQIAHVTGPDGEEIHCDEFGRVTVWFPWDRHGEKNQNSSCWVRVSQGWAGGTWGSMSIPRIGQEVVVDFLEGDPDQPIITGRTYHATNKPPYPLPENKTRMTIKSQTHKGSGYNELRFEDEAGKEEVWMHAQKDHNTVIENNETHSIGVDRSKSVGKNQTESVGANKVIDVAQNHTETIGANQTITVKATATETVEASKTVNVTSNSSHSAANISMSASGAEAGKQTLYAENLINLQVNGGAMITMTPDGIELEYKGSKITMSKGGVFINGKEIGLNC